ncbi:beta-propeller repeat protein [Geotalea daltonii FRC-32]|uniref:Beta-propeller repeat protein n=1 Tax=Geotalea daltonii (strain DSM 22248 / JCM 15807 / FRC-32) TaxID=316067 RepID=B9M542_GEODF|nr:YncE family protein [Geotalea daltonii]ACM19797.1 beta-propeller repeat protein [Geotalea daltonii FRC-32]
MYFRLFTALAGILMCAGYAAAYPFAYIPNPSQNTVSVVDTNGNNYLTPKISLGTGQSPFGVAVSANGKRVYISNKLSKSISVIDALTDVNNPTVITTISPLANTPSGIAINPAGTRLYVANNDAASLTVLDISALTPGTVAPTVLASPAVGNAPVGVAMDPAGTFVYVANSGSDTVSVIDTATNQVSGLPITVGSMPTGIAVGTVGSAVKIFVANQGSDNISIINAVTRAVTPVPVGAFPYTVAVAPDGSKAYVTNTFGDSISVINTADNSVTTPYLLPLGYSPMGLAITPDGTTLYAVNNTADAAPGNTSLGSLSSINLYSNAITNLPNTSGNPDFFNSPEALGNFIGPQLYTVTATSDTNGTVASIDGSKITSEANGNTFTQIVSPGDRPAYVLAPKQYYRVNNIAINGNIIDFRTDTNYNQTTSTYTFSPVNSDPSIDVTFIKDFDYVSVTRPADTVTANGAITSTPAGINCSASTSPSLCNVLFQEGASVTILATPNTGKYFVKWVGDRDKNGLLINNGALCDGLTTTSCTFTMSTYTHFTAVFSDTPVNDVVRMLSPGTTFYPTIQGAFNAVTAPTTDIQLALADFPESPNLNVSGAAFKLSGGWNADKTFTAQGPTPSTITGTLTITQGTLTVDNIAIK